MQAMPNYIQSLDLYFQKARLRFLGLGLLLAWVYSTWFSDAIFPLGHESGIESLRISLLGSSIGLLMLAFRPSKRKPLAANVVLLSSALVAFTTLLFLFLQTMPIYFLYIASAIGGFASAVLWVSWGETFCEIDLESTETAIPSSLLVFITAVLLVFLLPNLFAGILTSLYPLISGLLLLLSMNTLEPNYAFPKPQTPFSDVLPALGKLAFCSMVCSIATGCIMTSFSPENLLLPDNSTVLSYVLGGIIAGAITIFTIAFARRLNFSSLYEWAIPLIVFSLSLRALGGEVCITAASILACSAALYVEVFFFVIFARITSKGLCLPSETFGIFRAVVQFGFFIGAFTGTYLANPWGLPVYLVLICLCVIMLPLFIHLQARFEGYELRPALDNEESMGENLEPVSSNSVNSLEAIDLLSPAAQPSNALPINDSINILATQYKLSPRESEIFQYLAKGRSVPYMREELMISKSTIETHIKHIYSKMDVHSKQELLDLIEAHIPTISS